MKAASIRDFVDNIREHLEIRGQNEVSEDLLQPHMYSASTCLFTWDLVKGEMNFRSGFELLLGFSDETMTLEQFVSLMHPDEAEYIKRIGQAATMRSINSPEGNKEWVLYVAHRIKTADERYIHVLAESTPIGFDLKGQITDFLVKLTDISFKESNEAVHYNFIHPGLDLEEFHRSIYFEIHDLLTDREVEIIRLLSRKHNSAEIAQALGISRHTVSTHRKNILKKTSCHSVDELLAYCERNGLILD